MLTFGPTIRVWAESFGKNKASIVADAPAQENFMQECMHFSSYCVNGQLHPHIAHQSLVRSGGMTAWSFFQELPVNY